MKHHKLKVAFFVFILCIANVAIQAQSQPNIIFIMADDLGWCDLSSNLTNKNNASTHYKTPTLEILAEQGMSFDNAYVNGPNCAPSRSALLSGQFAQRPTNNIYLVKSLNRGGKKTMLVGASQGVGKHVELPAKTITIAETLKTAGYATAHAGKYHVGWNLPGNKPKEQGFDYNYGGTHAGGPGDYHAKEEKWGKGMEASFHAYAKNYTQEYVDKKIKPYSVNVPEADLDALVGTPKNVSDALADASIDFMETEKGKPFYLQLHQYAVHNPIGAKQARADLLKKYNKKPRVDDDGNGKNESDSYGAIIEGFDQCVSRVINYLKTTKDPRNKGKMLSENTLVIIFSDNGGRGANANNGPLKGQKGELFEGGIRVPMIAWSKNPKLVKAGTINSTPVMGVDFYTTFCDLAGADTSKLTLDGESLAPIFADNKKRLKRESLFWHLPGYLTGGGRNLRPASVIRSGKWKLAYTYEDQKFSLHDLSSDIGEKNDVSVQNPELVSSLATELMNWLEDLDSPLATLRSESKKLTVDGWAYANGKIKEYKNETITINAGDQMPFILQRIK